MSDQPALPPRRVAVIDLGSNSIKFLVADCAVPTAPAILLEAVADTRLGEGVDLNRNLSETAMQRTLDAVHEFKLRCAERSIVEWRAVATSAVRNAANRREFEWRFRERIGFPLCVLSGEEEAGWIYRGATSDREFTKPSQPSLVMDIGGGSAEWIIGAQGWIEKRISLELGCVRMTERFLRGDPYTEESYLQLLTHYVEQLGPLRDGFSARNRLMLGTGGSICTAAAMALALDSCEGPHAHGHCMSRESLGSLVDKLRRMPQARRANLRGLPGKRADIIVAGLALVVAAMRILEATEVTVSLRGLRHGALFSGN